MSLVVNSWTEDSVHSLFLLLYLFDPIIFTSMVQWAEGNKVLLYFSCWRCSEILLQCVSTCRGFFLLLIGGTIFLTLLYLYNTKPSRGLRKKDFIGCGDCSWMCPAALNSAPQPAYSSSQKHRRILEASAAVCTTQLHQITGRLLSL